MMLFLFISAILIFTYLFGQVIEKVRIPWVFSALILGLVLSFFGTFLNIHEIKTFEFLSDIGMYFLLFIIGLNINFKELKKQGKSISILSGSLVLGESIIGAIFIYYVFNVELWVSILVASSFATIGEAILIPILEEFDIIKTRFGQKLLGVGIIDDVVELVVIIGTSLVLGYSVINSNYITFYILFFILFVVLTAILFKFISTKIHHFKFRKVPLAFLFSLIIFFLFVGLGNYVEAGSLGAILAGTVIRNLLEKKTFNDIEVIVNSVAYGLFVPIFFLNVGMSIDIKYLLGFPLLVLAVLLITSFTKLLTSYFITKKEFGTIKSILLGVGLSAKFSTSIVVLSILYTGQIISLDLYSVLIGAMIISEFLIPFLFSWLIKNLNLKFTKV